MLLEYIYERVIRPPKGVTTHWLRTAVLVVYPRSHICYKAVSVQPQMSWSLYLLLETWTNTFISPVLLLLFWMDFALLFSLLQI